METIKVKTLADAEQAIKNRQPFAMRDTLSATTEWNGARGFLPWPDYHESIKDAVYVVISYGTPIAWVDKIGNVIVPDVGYTPTTGQHQYLAAHALGVEFRPARGRRTVDVPRTDRLYGRARRLRRGGVDE